MHAVRAPDVAREPAELREVLDRCAPVELPAVRLLLPRLREVRVEDEPEPPRELGGFAHELPGHGERGAGRDRDLHARARPRLVQLVREALGLREHAVQVLDELVRRQASVRRAEVHRPAGGDDPHAELPRRLYLRLDET